MKTRREFLRQTAAATALTTVAGVFNGTDSFGASSKKRRIKKAIMYATVGYKGTVLEQFKALKAAGFEGVEPMSHMNRDEVSNALKESGLKAASVCCATHGDKPLSDPNPAVREAGVEGLKHALQDAKHYGATSVLLVPGFVGGNVSYDDCFQRSILEIRKVIPFAEDLGVKIAVENVWNNFITKPEQAMDYLHEINSPQVGWHFDIGNVIKYSPPEQWIPVIGKRILKLHVKEFSKAKGFDVKFSEGDNHWPAIMKALDDIGYSGWGISEQPSDQTRDAGSLKDFSQRMDRLFAS